MALVGTKLQVAQDGNTTVAVKTDLIVDERTGLLAERETVVAEVLTESGNHRALIAGEQIRVASVAPPVYSPRRDYTPAPRYPVEDDSTNIQSFLKKKCSRKNIIHCIICISYVLLLALAVGYAAAPDASGRDIIGIIIGVCVLFTVVRCVFFLCEARLDDYSTLSTLRPFVDILTVLVFLAMVTAEATLVGLNHETTDDKTPLTITILSWVIWLLILLLSFFGLV